MRCGDVGIFCLLLQGLSRLMACAGCGRGPERDGDCESHVFPSRQSEVENGGFRS